MATVFLNHVPAGDQDRPVAPQCGKALPLFAVQADHGQRIAAAAAARQIKGETPGAESPLAGLVVGPRVALGAAHTGSRVAMREKHGWVAIREGRLNGRIRHTVTVYDVRPPRGWAGKDVLGGSAARHPNGRSRNAGGDASLGSGKIGQDAKLETGGRQTREDVSQVALSPSNKAKMRGGNQEFHRRTAFDELQFRDLFSAATRNNSSIAAPFDSAANLSQSARTVAPMRGRSARRA